MVEAHRAFLESLDRAGSHRAVDHNRDHIEGSNSEKAVVVVVEVEGAAGSLVVVVGKEADHDVEGLVVMAG